MSIGPISGIGPITQGIGAASGASRPTTTPESGGGFADLVKNVADKANANAQQADVAIGDLIAGRTDNVLPVVSAVAQSDMSFKLLIGVRNKVVEAYKQTMQMQI